MVTVRELVEEPALALSPVHLPAPDSEVRWVATSELADPAPFLEGGEVLLTTGLGTAGWDRRWDRYVARLAAVDVAAVGLAVGLTHDRVPAGLVAACQRHGVNLFEVPRQTTFVAVSRTVARRLQDAERQAARAALDLQRGLTQAALRDDDERSVLTLLAESGGGAACTVGVDGQVQTPVTGPRPELLDLRQGLREVERIRSMGLRAASSLDTADGALLVQPLGVRGRPSAYLLAAFPGRLGDAQRSAVVTAVALLSLAAERRRTGRETDRALRARAVELLLRGEARTAALVLAARPVGGRVRFPRRPVVIRAAGDPDACTDALVAVEDQTALSALLDDELVVVAAPRQVDPAVDSLAARALRVGVGELVELDELQRSHATAGFALRATTATSPVAFWETSVDRGVLSLVEADKAAAFADSLLGPLVEDARGELLDTLQVFLRHHGSMARTASELGVHRNTVRLRLDAVEKALGRSLDDPQTRVDCWVALQARAGTT